MRIAIFTNNYLPNPYGVTTSIESFRKEFEKMGHTVYIFAPENKGFIDENPNVFRYPSLDTGYKIKFPLPIPYSIEMDRKIRELDIDIIHSQHPNLLGSAARKWAKKKNVPLIFTWHTLYDKYTHYAPLIPKKISAYWVINNAVGYANKADRVIIPTVSIKGIIENWGVNNKEIFDIPTGVESSCFENPDGEKIRKKLNIADDKKIIMSISRFTEEKNVIFLLKSVIKTLRENPSAVFVFGGDGYLKKDMEEIVKMENLRKRVIFPGIVDKDDMKNYFKVADIFVSASKSETQGTIITESMYSVLPIVALDATGTQSLIENNKTGILVPEDEDKFAEAVSKLVRDENLAQNLSRNAKIVADEKYTSEVCARRMLEVYEEAIRNKNK